MDAIELQQKYASVCPCFLCSVVVWNCLEFVFLPLDEILVVVLGNVVLACWVVDEWRCCDSACCIGLIDCVVVIWSY